MSDLWRTGRKVGRTIYYDDNLSGVMDTAALAKRVVDALNGAADVARLTKERDEARANAWDDVCGEVANLTRERDEARADRDGFDADRIALALQNDKLHAEVERLRAALTRIESLSETLSAYVALAEDSGPGGAK